MLSFVARDPADDGQRLAAPADRQAAAAGAVSPDRVKEQVKGTLHRKPGQFFFSNFLIPFLH